LTWPTAWQKDTPAHDTELNALPRPAVGWGVVWSAHAVPFHSSLKDDPGADGVVSPFPTAMHQLAVTQSMPVALGRGVPDVTGGVAAVVAARLVPFHWFPKMEFVPATVAVPRISHVVAATQDTDERDVTVLPAGTAEVTNDHDVPFHVSATGPVVDPPTARQKVVATHDTELRVSPVVAGAFTLGTTVHVVPLHCSMRLPPPGRFSEPTATQKVEVVHDTSFSWFEPEPAAALELVQFVAATVGGLVMVLAPAGAGGETKGPAKSASSVPAAAARNIRNAGMIVPSSSRACARQSRARRRRSRALFRQPP
jgi:hypothetical protein